MVKLALDDLDPEVLRDVEQMARRNGLTLSQQVNRLLAGAAHRRGHDRVVIAKDIAALTPPGPQTDSVLLLREDRDR